MSPKFFVKVIVICASIWSIPIHADNHHQHAAAYKPVELANNLYWLSGGKGGNILLSTGDDGILLIDDDFEDLSPALIKILNPFGGIEAVDFIINTHWHGDHTQGNLSLGKTSTIVAHDNVRKRLQSTQEVPLFNMKSKPYPRHALPSVTYSRDITLHHNGHTINLLHFPNSHTDSDSVVFFEEANLVHMGDLYFNGFFPFVDVSNGGNVINMSKSIDNVLAKINDNTIVIPGHGPMSNKAELAAFNAMLKGTASEVRALKTKGLTLQEAQEKGLSNKWDNWTKGFIPVPVWIEIVFNSL